jgi:hypothetical protein
VEILGYAGPRASELCDIKIGHVRLHDPDDARFRIPDSKTETGIREVQISPDLVQTITEHLDRLRRTGAPTGPEDYLVPNLNGKRIEYGRLERIVREAAELASEKLAEKGLPPLPHTTPHTLRRTYISIALVAYEWDVKYVMDQVGHADSKMTLDVYAQMQQRAKRDNGAKFDKLIRGAREQANEPASEPSGGLARIDRHRFGTGNGTNEASTAAGGRSRRPHTSPKTRRFAGHSAMGETARRANHVQVAGQVLRLG